MDFAKQFLVSPGERIDIDAIDANYRPEGMTKKSSREDIRETLLRLSSLQYRLYAEDRRSLLIVLQGRDAAGKDGTIRHVFGGLNPQGCRVTSFKVPSSKERAHDFLWRIHQATPARGEVGIFNRSHYEDVLVVRVHDLVPESVWSQRYAHINAFERQLADNGTRILKFYLHIDQQEQLDRFRARLEEPDKRWKISESDYTERRYWDAYTAAFQDALSKCSTAHAPWFAIPANRKWFRNLAISRIVADTLESMQLQVPEPTVDIGDIRARYHAAVQAP
jgi:PPK2 family polyphosphate:nucleotide phosphotransferase